MKHSKLLIFTIVLAVCLVVGGVFTIIQTRNDRDKISELNNEIANLSKTISNQKDQIDTLTAEVANKSGQIDTLTADVANKSGQIDTLTADVADKSGQIDALTADVADKSSQIDALTADMAEKLAQIETLTAEMAAKTSENQQLNEEVAKKAEDVKSLAAQLAENTTQVASLKAEVSDKDAQIESLNAALETANRENGTEVEPKVVEPVVPVLSGDNWAITQEYSYSSYTSYFSGIVIHHSKTDDQAIEVNFQFYNDKNELIGVASESITAASSNIDYFMRARNDAPYHYVTYTVKLKDVDYVRSASNHLSVSTSIVGQKVILTANNTGEEKLLLTRFDVLYFNQNGDLVATDYGYFDDIEPGESVLVESKPSPNEPFSSVKVYSTPDVYTW